MLLKVWLATGDNFSILVLCKLLCSLYQRSDAFARQIFHDGAMGLFFCVAAAAPSSSCSVSLLLLLLLLLILPEGTSLPSGSI
jgi:hypothetical protein